MAGTRRGCSSETVRRKNGRLDERAVCLCCPAGSLRLAAAGFESTVDENFSDNFDRAERDVVLGGREFSLLWQRHGGLGAVDWDCGLCACVWTCEYGCV